MKNSLSVVLAAFIGLASLSLAGSANNSMIHDGVMMKDGQMMIIKNGELVPMKTDMKMASGLQVTTDGTVTPAVGQKFTLKDGDSLSMDGTLQKSDDAMSMGGMKRECLMMKDGQMMVMKKGECKAMMEDVTLTDGTKVMKNGAVTKTDGQTIMLKDGEMVSMNGEMMKTGDKMPGMSGNRMMQDGVMMTNGQMMVIKEGKASMMTEDMKMKDGCTVMVDGTVTKPKSPNVMMKEGDAMSMDGKMMNDGM